MACAWRPATTAIGGFSITSSLSARTSFWPLKLHVTMCSCTVTGSSSRFTTCKVALGRDVETWILTGLTVSVPHHESIVLEITQKAASAQESIRFLNVFSCMMETFGFPGGTSVRALNWRVGTPVQLPEAVRT